MFEHIRKALFYSHGKNLTIGPWKRMWMEIPHIPFFGIQVIVVGSYVVWDFFKNYKPGIGLQANFTVMRSDDPRVKRFKPVMEPPC